ncbi:hypothetical protein [Mycolicibacterium vaccae]|uniref:hypothetical protein n=1 Tax=Mycolicibacterium vaccae TaxID=1810 RepID=UPI003D04CFCB
MRAVSRRTLASVLLPLLCLTGCSSGEETPPGAAPALPEQTLLAGPLRHQPVPGWTTTVADLGLPPGTAVKPIGAATTRGVFLGIGANEWWLVGIDITNGERTFDPVRLGSSTNAAAFNCYLNGPPDVLCVRQERDPATRGTAWVIDTDAGAVSYEGPTEVKVAYAQGQPRLQPIGDRVVATVEGRGVHGVGSRAEFTWFVPGDGILPAQFASWDHDTTRAPLAVQGAGAGADVVFSLSDGAVVEPALPVEARLRRAVVYPGGFGYEYSDGVGDRVALFDAVGTPRGESIPAEGLETRSLDLPVVRTPTDYVVIDADGRQILELPRTGSSPHVRLIGSRLYVAQDPVNRDWQQFDLETGDAGPTCTDGRLGFDYVGSDGDVAVVRGDGILARAVDLTTCETLWTMPTPQDQITELWRVDTALVQRTDDTLSGLASPN